MFAFSQEHQMVRQLIRKWAATKLEPKLDALEAGEPPYEVMRDFIKAFGIADMVRGSFGKMVEGEPSKRAGFGSGDPAMGVCVDIPARSTPGIARTRRNISA